VDNSIPVLNLDLSIPWCEGDVITLDAAQPFSAEYLWSTGALTSSIDVSAPAIYNITVSTLCSSLTQEVDVYPGDECVVPDVKNGFYIPNVFSPNGDGINDVFTVSFGPDLNVISMQGSIYDRWGNLVFSSAGYPFEWDGLFAGETVLPGVYVYTITVLYLENGIEKERQLVGDVTVIK
jgi:gliding motility-associated-like protein